MKKGTFMVSYLHVRSGLVAALCMLSPLFCVAGQATPDSAAEQAPLFLSFQVPDSTAIFPESINDLMVVTGSYTTRWGASRGFVRYADGTIITFTVPGAMATQPVSINHGGDITGSYMVPEPPGYTSLFQSVRQGFVRAANGTITTFGNTSNGIGAYGTYVDPLAINLGGEVVGNENDGLGATVFTRSASGSVQKFSLGSGVAEQTYAAGINASGAILGSTTSQGAKSQLDQGFLWSGNGPLPSPVSDTATPIIADGSTWTIPLAINAGGMIVGCYRDPYHTLDFVRDQEGTITTLNIPGVNEAECNVTVNDAGTILGYYANAADVNIGFFKPYGGKVVTFAYPGATDTFPTSLNNLDVITGWYSNGSTTFGFIFAPGSSAHVH
jgi:hypothetical protein